MSATGISVVTTTWNERENIKNLILSVRTELKGVPHEIIVVDDNSPDGTIHVAKRYADVAVTKKREGARAKPKDYSTACGLPSTQ